MSYFEKLLRPNIQQLKPYSSARDEYSGEAAVFLDANENPFNDPYNRYPDPYQRILKQKLGAIKGVDAASIFLGNGSDEPIDIVYRAFCEPGVDNVVSIDPTYGMYQVAADINNIKVRKVLLTSDFQIDVKAMLSAVDANTKLMWICSPNNPTGNCLKNEDIEALLKSFNGMVILDEAYIDFAPEKSFVKRLAEFPNLIILQTLSKAWGMAGLRLGMAFTSPELVKVFNKIKYPYNINILTQGKVLDLLSHEKQKEAWVTMLLDERKVLSAELAKLPFVKHQYPSDSNFVLVKTMGARKIYQYLVDNKVIVRDRSSVALCEDCLRITVGSPEENKELLDALKNYQS